MANAKERHAMEELMRDPAFRDAWTELEAIVATLDLANMADPDKFALDVRFGLGKVEAVLDQRPELAALAEAADSLSH